MRIAVIDLGSNSIRLLVADIKANGVSRVYRDLATTRLGRGVAMEGMLNSEAMAKTLSAIKSFLDEAENFRCDTVLAFGTNALREAGNRWEFLQTVKRETGLNVEILSGQEEAELSFAGAKAGLGFSGAVLVVDIGGGSTELSFGDDKGIFVQSLPMGAVRWTQDYIKNDPPEPLEITAATAKAKGLMKDIAKRISERAGDKGYTAVGVGGTWTTLAAVAQEMSTYDPEKIHGYCLGSSEVFRINQRFFASTLHERRQIPGIPAARADIITAGAIIAGTVMEQLGIEELQISEADLQEGFLAKKIQGI